MKRMVIYGCAVLAVVFLSAAGASATTGVEIPQTPEPATWLLIGMGGAGLAAYRRMKNGRRK